MNLSPTTPAHEVRAEWYRRLREDNIPQAKKTLCRKRPDGTIGYCCLGVATEMAVEAGVIEPGKFRKVDGQRGEVKEYAYRAPGYEGGPMTTFSEEGTLPPPVQKWLGLADANPFVGSPDHTAAEVNDKGTKFPRIAGLLEARYPTDPAVGL